MKNINTVRRFQTQQFKLEDIDDLNTEVEDTRGRRVSLNSN
jgi:hypothetical protein